MKQRIQKVLCLTLALAFMMGMSFAATIEAKTAKKPKLNKTKLSLQVNKSATLKVKNTKKKVKWSSSKKSVATVSQKGKVKAKKKGTATITAKVGKRKLKCKVKVTKAKKKTPSGSVSNTGTNTGNNTKPVTVTPVDTPIVEKTLEISSVSVLNSSAIVVTLTKAQSLKPENFTIKTKKYSNGTYYHTVGIESVSTSNQISYLLELKNDDFLSFNDFVQVTLTGVNITSNPSKETVYSDVSPLLPENCTLTCTAKEKTEKHIYLDGYGYHQIVSQDLPQGLSCKLAKEGGSEILCISGTPTSTGKYNKKIVYSDELDNIFTVNILWIIGDNQTLLAGCQPSYGIKEENEIFYDYNYFNVTGGSGEYSYKVLDNDSVTITNTDTQELFASLSSAGQHTATIEVTDVNNSQLKCNFTWDITLVTGKTVNITFTDANEESITSDAAIDVYFTNQDKKNLFLSTGYCCPEENGKCRITLPDGTYDVRAILGPSYISLGSSGQYQVTKNIVNYKVSENNQNLNIKMPVYKVSLSATDRNMNLSGMVWYDEENNTIGLGSSLYLKPGAYKIHGTKQEGLTTYSSQATFNVTTASNAVTLDVTIKNLSKGTLTLDTPYATTITGKTSYYSFTPVENGTYKFYSTGDANTCCTLLNYNLNFLTYNDDGDDMNFLLTYNCEAGKTYYLNVRLLDSSSTNSMDVTLHVEKETEDLE